MPKEKSKHLVAYVIAQYGLRNLGNLRLLASFEEFRDLSVVGEQQKLLSAPQMLSFEKALRLTHGIHWERKSGSFCLVDANGPRTFPDDQFGTVIGSMVHQIRELYPDLHAFPLGPIVQLGHGVDVDGVIDSFDHRAFKAKFLDNIQANPRYTQLAKRYNDHAGALVNCGAEDEKPPDMETIDKLHVFEAIHQVYVQLRCDADADMVLGALPTSGHMPFAEDAELGQVLFGLIRRSVKFPRKPAASLINTLQEAMPEGRYVEEDNVFLVPAPFDPYSLLNLGHCAIPMPGVPQQPRNGALAVAPQAELPRLNEEAGPSGSGHDIELAVAHVEKFFLMDLNKMLKHEKIIARFGSEEGKQVFEAMPKNAQKEYNKHFEERDYTPQEWLLHGADYISSKLARPPSNLTLYLLVAGRVVAIKGSMIIGPDVWRKK